MKKAPKNRVQPAVAAGALATMLSVSGCNFYAEQSTAEPYAPSDGIVEEVGPLLMRNILIVSTDDGTAGRFIGTVFNSSDEPVDLSISAGGPATDITIDAGGELRFEDETSDDATLDGLDSRPGSLVSVDFGADDETTAFRVPVLDGTLEEYREYVPGGYTPRPSEPASTEEAEEGE